MTKPTIHTNGTSAQELLDGLGEIHVALNNAVAKLYEYGPNARDYYPQGDAAFAAARDEHASRIERVRSVIAEIEEIAESI